MAIPMNTEGQRLRTRNPPPSPSSSSTPLPNGDLHPLKRTSTTADDLLGAPRFGVFMQALRVLCIALYFFGSCIFIHFAQLLGAPLYFVSKPWFYAYMALTKQYFGLLVTTTTQWWSPTLVRVSGDKSMSGLLKQDKDGMISLDFGERIVLMANHQIYTDWLYLWWAAYTNDPPTHGHIYIILKESLKYVPLLGPAMMFYGFVFMARKWSTDQQRLRHRLQKLNSQHSGPLDPSTQQQPGAPNHLDPMWLLIFPEGTNLSANTRSQSSKFAAKTNIDDMRHLLLPRSTGLQFCLQELQHTVEYLYDCTIAYEPIPAGSYGQDIFTLRTVYFEGRPPKSVNMHWRRFKISEIPFDDKDAMHEWVMQRWREKDDLVEAFLRQGKFPADAEAVKIEGAPMEKGFRSAYINTEVKPRSPLEFMTMFMPVLTVGLVGRIGVLIVDRLTGN